MRSVVLWLGLAGIVGAQSMTEFGAAAAGGATGAAAGKKVSEGITAIFGKVDKQAADAAKTGKPTETKPTAKATPPPAEVEPSVPAVSPASPPKAAKTLKKREPNADQNVAKSKGKTDKDDPYNLVPPPPPIQRVAIGRPVEPAPRVVTQVAAIIAPAPVIPPPPPPVTVEDLRTITPGTNREDLLRLGAFSFRITSVDNGHLAETFRYPVGEVRVTDGVVAAVEFP